MMKTKILCVLVILSVLLSLTACDSGGGHSVTNDSYNQGNSTETSNNNEDGGNEYNTKGDFQSSLLNMAIEGDWIFYSNYYDLRDGIKRTLVDGGEYSKYNIETVFVPNEHREEMAAKLGWNNPETYEIEDIISINNLQVVNNWVYWASECAIWRFPNMLDASIFDLELVAVIGTPERPTSTNFYVDGDWVYYACNAIKEQYDLSTALIEHSLCKKNLNTNEVVVLDSASSTEEKLGDITAAGRDRYNTLIIFKTVCGDGRIYYSNYEKDNIQYYKDGKICDTFLPAYEYCRCSFKQIPTGLYSSKNGNIVAAVDKCNDNCNFSDNRFYYHFSDMTLSDGEEIEDFSLITNDGWYYSSYGGEEDAFGVRDYMGYYKIYFNSEDEKKITNDKIRAVGICGDYLYYYTESKALCRTGINGGNWEDVSWMIK